MRRLFARAIAVMLLLAVIATWTAGLPVGAEPPAGLEASYRIPLTVTSQLPAENVPLDPLVDFEKVLSAIDAAGVLDPNSIEVREMGTGRVVAHSLGDGFGVSNRARPIPSASRCLFAISEPELNRDSIIHDRSRCGASRCTT